MDSFQKGRCQHLSTGHIALLKDLQGLPRYYLHSETLYETLIESLWWSD
ncbi:MAG: hypothetical protein ACMUJM_12630 [bacterium]